ncbi:MAG: hypothetical protein LBT30_05255 [Clostridiales bacterium]|jgi:TPR repeat protein|nr:hypothetical protein [Clostridiales bacterium]
MIKRRYVLAFLFLALAIAGIAVEIILVATGDIEYLSHMSVITGILIELWLLIASLGIIFGYKRFKGTLGIIGARVQGALSTYAIGVALVFWFALAGRIAPFNNDVWITGFVGFANILNNAILPLFMLFVWIFFPIDKKRPKKSDPVFWLIPLYVYFFVLIIIGMNTNWFPYAFLDPNWAFGLIGGDVILTLLLALAVTAALAAVFYYVGKLLVLLRIRQLDGKERTSTAELLLIDESMGNLFSRGSAAGEKVKKTRVKKDREIFGNGYDGEDLDKIVNLYKKPADEGDAYAQLVWGVVNEKGLGIPQDYVQAAYWYATSAEGNNSDGQNNLGVLYEKGLGVTQDYDKSAGLYRSAAAKGNANAQYNLGRAYYNGWGVPQDYERAAEWYKKSADQGNAKAQNNLADCCEKGLGVEKDTVLAERLRKRAGEKDPIFANEHIICYEAAAYPDNDDVFSRAYETYSKPAEEGNADAQLILGVANEKGLGVPKDAGQAAYWYAKAAKQGNPDAQNNLGVLYNRGEGVQKDDAKAAKWYDKAIAQDDANAEYNAANGYYNGKGVEKDYAKALDLYTKAAEQGNSDAQNNLAYMYEKGYGTPQDLEKAKYWYARAAEQGNENTLKSLGMSYKPSEYPLYIGYTDSVNGNKNAYQRLVDDEAIAAREAKAVEDARKAAKEAEERYRAIKAEEEAAKKEGREPVYSREDIEKAYRAFKDAEEAYLQAKAIEEAYREARNAEMAKMEAKITEDTYKAAKAAEEAKAAQERAEAAAARASEDARYAKNAKDAADEAARKAAEETARKAEEEAKGKKKVVDDDDDDEYSSVESFSILSGEGKKGGEEGDETPVMDIPDGYVYQDGWYYVSETGERVEFTGIRDDFYTNLPDELKPEFKDLFVDGRRINIPRFPFYVIDGDNTMFFRLVFTYITRYRKVISIELLDILYSYLVDKFTGNYSIVAKINDKLIRIYFARRKEPGVQDKCEAKCREDIEYNLKNVSDYPSNLYSFKRLVMILERQDNLYEARDYCKKALELGLVDGTKAGYPGRLERIERRIAEEEAVKSLRL